MDQYLDIFELVSDNFDYGRFKISDTKNLNNAVILYDYEKNGLLKKYYFQLKTVKNKEYLLQT